MLRWLIGLGLAGAVVVAGATVDLGGRTLYDHLARIGASDEARDLQRGVSEAVGRQTTQAVAHASQEAARELAERVAVGARAGLAAARAGGAADAGPDAAPAGPDAARARRE